MNMNEAIHKSTRARVHFPTCVDANKPTRAAEVLHL